MKRENLSRAQYVVNQLDILERKLNYLTSDKYVIGEMNIEVKFKSSSDRSHGNWDKISIDTLDMKDHIISRYILNLRARILEYKAELETL